MLIDRTHRKWFMATALLLAVASAAYIPYALAPGGPTGGSVPGLVYGSVASAFMLIAGLLGVRKKFRIVRIGRAQAWMRAHLWLGFAAFPLILLHGGFHFGGRLTSVLMWLFIVVFVSGILGAVLQHYMPRIYTERLPMETIYDQIERVRGQLVDEAGRLAESACETLAGELTRATPLQRATAASAGTQWDVTFAEGLQANEQLAAQMREFVADELIPYLRHAGPGRFALADSGRSRGMFQHLRLLVPANLVATVEDLENISEEKRELDRQRRMHRLLHGWLLVHIPLSYALLVLGAIHAVFALRY
jgi:hypothetical protein